MAEARINGHAVTLPDVIDIDVPPGIAEADVVYDVLDSTLKLANIKMYPQHRYGRDTWFFFAGTLIATVGWGLAIYFVF